MPMVTKRDITQGAGNHKFARPYNGRDLERSYAYLNTLHLHLQKVFGQQTRQSVDLQ